MLPSFLCIGAQKAGTSWLFAQLQSHPKVWMPPMKELQYFNHLYVPEHRAWTSWHIRQGAARALEYHVGRDEAPDFGYVRYLADLGSRELFTDGWYRRAFERPAAQGKLVGEITPEYSTIPEAGIRHLRALLGAVRIIYLIRAPVSRALSQLQMNLSRKGNLAPDEAQWIEAADQWDIDNRGDYARLRPALEGALRRRGPAVPALRPGAARSGGPDARGRGLPRARRRTTIRGSTRRCTRPGSSRSPSASCSGSRTGWRRRPRSSGRVRAGVAALT